MIEHLYVNGCSHAMDYQIRQQGTKQYADLLSDQNGWTLNNRALPGTCNQRIIRSTVKDSVNFSPNTLALISLTYLDRTEIGVEEEPRTPEQALWHQDYFVPIKSDGWSGDSRTESYAKEYYKLFDWYSSFVNLATGVFLLTQLFKQRNIQYLIFNYSMKLTPTQQAQVQHHPIVQEIEKDSSVLSIVSDCLIKHIGPGNWYYDKNFGHFDESGHAHAAKVIQQLINQHA
jgi:hypothetical protein